MPHKKIGTAYKISFTNVNQEPVIVEAQYQHATNEGALLLFDDNFAEGSRPVAAFAAGQWLACVVQRYLVVVEEAK